MGYEKRLSAVKVEYKEYFTIDNYETELVVDRRWKMMTTYGLEKNLSNFRVFLKGSGLIHPLYQMPAPPESLADELADMVEIQRLCAMQILKAKFVDDSSRSL